MRLAEVVLAGVELGGRKDKGTSAATGSVMASTRTGNEHVVYLRINRFQGGLELCAESVDSEQRRDGRK